jgi:non-canonical (house-cleaning) NTP pyrophosphatase
VRNKIILLGSISKNKINYTREILTDILPITFDLLPLKVDSMVNEQPLDLNETICGAKNRATVAIKAYNKKFDYSIGLEGGLVMKNGIFRLVCVAAVLSADNVQHLGISDEIILPSDVSNMIKQGKQFGDIIYSYNKKYDADTKRKNKIKELKERRRSFQTAIQRAWQEI